MKKLVQLNWQSQIAKHIPAKIRHPDTCALSKKPKPNRRKTMLAYWLQRNNFEILHAIFVESLNGIPAVVVLLQTKFEIFAKW